MLQEPAGILSSTTILPSQYNKNGTWTRSITSYIRSRIFIHKKLSWRGLVWCCLMYLLKTEILKQDIKLITKSEEAGPCKAKAVSQEKFDCCIRKHSLLDTVSQELVTSCKYAMLLLTSSPAGEKMYWWPFSKDKKDLWKKQRILLTFWCKVPSVSKGNAVSDHIANAYFPKMLRDFKTWRQNW